MIRIDEELAGDLIQFNCVESTSDLKEARDFIKDNNWLGFDTESTGVNCYRRGWQLRTAQWGNRECSYVVPARYRKFIGWAMAQPVRLIGHNGPHDIRSIDRHLGYETGVQCVGETYIPAHHEDSRSWDEGGVGHKLKEQAIAKIGFKAGRWEDDLKAEFKMIMVRIPGEYYKSGPRKGQPKFRKARLAEGWGLIDPFHPAYIAYAAADPVLTYRLWELEQTTVREFRDLYRFDKRVAEGASRLQRRAMLVDVRYTERLNSAYARKAEQMRKLAWDRFQCANVNSGDQVAETLLRLKVRLRAKTDTGKWKTDATILRRIMKDPNSSNRVREFVHCVLLAKQVEKRRKNYTEAFLMERDEDDRVHPSINTLAAVTSRWSVSGPPLQQLPTKDHEDEEMWELIEQ